MSITRLRYRPFRLALRTPIETARATIEHRAGVVVELVDSAGRRGLGEASPMPEFDEGGADDVLRLIEAHAPAMLRGDALPDDERGPGSAALQCALDVALLDLEGQQQDVPLAALLAEEPRATVEANAVIGDGAPARVLEQVRAAWEAGFVTLKLKVGARPADEDVRRVRFIRMAMPEARLRLDANGGWDEATAADTLRRLEGCELELVEQPVPVGATEELARLSRSAPCLVAADEAVASLDDGRGLLAAGAVGALVLKPMRLGGIRPALALAREAAGHGVACVVTTTFDSGIGIAAALHLAAAVPAVDALPDPAHGLATADHLAADIVVEPPRPSDGSMTLTRRPGLGVELDMLRLDAAATAPWTALDA